MKINPQNKMSDEKLNEFKDSIDSGGIAPKPVLEMDPGRIMPLYMFIGNVRAPKIGDTKMNYMLAESHLIKTGEIEVRGRMRYEATGRKTVFGLKEKFKLKDLDKAKKAIRDAYEDTRSAMWLIEIKPVAELNFEVGESMDSIIRKMNDSNEFNIGQVNKK